MSDVLEWTGADYDAALAEGWNLFSSDGTGCQIERIDDPDGWPRLPDGSAPPLLASDDEAHRIVRDGALRGSALHSKALAMVTERERRGILTGEWPQEPDA
jgi:hypothetical protein